MSSLIGSSARGGSHECWRNISHSKVKGGTRRRLRQGTRWRGKKAQQIGVHSEVGLIAHRQRVSDWFRSGWSQEDAGGSAGGLWLLQCREGHAAKGTAHLGLRSKQGRSSGRGGRRAGLLATGEAKAQLQVKIFPVESRRTVKEYLWGAAKLLKVAEGWWSAFVSLLGQEDRGWRERCH